MPISSISESESSDEATESILQYKAINRNSGPFDKVRATITYRETSTLSFCHRGAFDFFLLFLFGDTSLSLPLSILPVLGTSVDFYISVLG